jgi:hypothetical protein
MLVFWHVLGRKLGTVGTAMPSRWLDYAIHLHFSHAHIGRISIDCPNYFRHESLRTLLEAHGSIPARNRFRNQSTQILPASSFVQQAVSHEYNQVLDLARIQVDGAREPRINTF